MNYLKVIKNGMITENPTFALLLGMCPTLATTSSAINGMSMGLATAFVLICSNAAISAIKKLVPDEVRIPVYVVVIASFVTILQMCMQAYMPELYKSLGLFIPLIVVNCIGIGVGFPLALTLLGTCRELLGTGRAFSLTLFPEHYGALLFVLAPGAFIALGYLIAIVNKLKK